MSGRPALPTGFRLRFAPSVRVVDGGRTVVGPESGRALRLTDRGAAVLTGLRRGEAVTGPSDGALARRIVDAGIADPIAPATPFETSMCVVVPAYDRPDDVAECLAVLGAGMEVVVSDDGSRRPERLSAVAAEHGASLVRRTANRGPAAARNAGARATTADLVAFVDSDARISATTLVSLAAHFADPCVGAVAPRIVPDVTSGSVLARFAAARSPLDMGERPADVGVGVVPYVPSTVMLVRRSAWVDVGGFDESLRHGEDVDLVWRLLSRSWCVRYVPEIRAAHREPARWSSWLRRRYRYGTSAGALGLRHPERMRGPALAGLAAPVRIAAGLPRLRDARLPLNALLVPAATAPARTFEGAARWALPLWWPLLLAAAMRARLRPLAVAALVTPSLTEWWRRRPSVDPVTYAAAAFVDDVAYGAGVWTSCVRTRTLRPMIPRWSAPRRVSISESPPMSAP